MKTYTRISIALSLLVLLAGFTTMPQDPWWHQSLMLGYFEHVADFLRSTIAPEIAKAQ